MAASAPMQQYASAMAENRLRDQMGQQQGMSPGAPGMDDMMAQLMASKANATVLGKGRKAKRRK